VQLFSPPNIELFAPKEYLCGIQIAAECHETHLARAKSAMFTVWVRSDWRPAYRAWWITLAERKMGIVFRAPKKIYGIVRAAC